MSSVASRTFASTPRRDAAQTWTAIVDLLTGGKDGPARKELCAVAGVAASTITDQAPRDDAIIVTCDRPRTRIYCLFDDDAIEGSDANEDPLGFDPLNGDWRVHGALKKHGSRITARELGAEVAKAEEAQTSQAHTLTFDPKGFLGS
jgi:hypothetical protein